MLCASGLLSLGTAPLRSSSASPWATSPLHAESSMSLRLAVRLPWPAVLGQQPNDRFKVS